MTAADVCQFEQTSYPIALCLSVSEICFYILYLSSILMSRARGARAHVHGKFR